MTIGRVQALIAGLAIVAAACSADAEPMSLHEYAAAMQAVENSFVADAPDPSAGGVEVGQYPLGGDLVMATVLYSEFERRLAGWRAITPPASVARQHDRLVAALDAVQREVGDYLGGEAMTGTEFDFGAIGGAVGPFLQEASGACRELRSVLIDAGAPVRFAGNCNF